MPGPVTRPAQPRGERRRAEVLRAATALMTARGTAAVTHRSVAEAAAASLSAIRYYYASRELLLLACVDEVEARRAAAAEQALASARAHPPADARGVAALLLTSFYGPDQDDATLAGTIGWVVDCARESEALSERLAAARALMDRQLADVLEACGRSGLAVSLAQAVMDGVIVTSSAERRPGIADRAVRELAAVLELSVDRS